jgi:hypothetical protein
MSGCNAPVGVVARGTGRVAQRLSDTAEARRLRAMLRAVEDCEGATIGMIAIDVCPEDGLQVILSGNRIDEADPEALAKAWVGVCIDAHALLATAMVQALWRDHPEMAQRYADEAAGTLRAAAAVHHDGKGGCGDE